MLSLVDITVLFGTPQQRMIVANKIRHYARHCYDPALCPECKEACELLAK